MTDLPKPIVTSESSADAGVQKINVTVTRDGKARSWSGAGTSVAGAARDLVEKMIEDHHTAEYVK